MGEPNEYADPTVVRGTYDRIATHFARTRAHPWPEVASFVDENDAVDRALDVGCANGRHAEVLAQRARRVIGLDASRALLEEANRRAETRSYPFEAIQGDATTLPLRADSVDLAVYVATIHHLPDRAHRVRSLDELGRVLRPGARALVSAWSTVHERFDDERFDDERDDAGNGEAHGFDTTIDWTLPGGERVPRFYHIYAPAEFERELADSDLDVVESWLSSGNCYAVVTANPGT